MDAMINAIEFLIQHPEQQARLRLAARQTINDKQLTWTANGEKIVRLFEQYLSRTEPTLLSSQTGG